MPISAQPDLTPPTEVSDFSSPPAQILCESGKQS